MANDYSNIRNNFMYGSKNRKNNFYQNYKNFENDLEDPIFTGFTLSINEQHSPLFSGGLTYSYTGSIQNQEKSDTTISVNAHSLASQIENKLKNMDRNTPYYSVSPFETFDGSHKIGYGNQENYLIDNIDYGAIEYIYMTDKFLKQTGTNTPKMSSSSRLRKDPAKGSDDAYLSSSSNSNNGNGGVSGSETNTNPNQDEIDQLKNDAKEKSDKILADLKANYQLASETYDHEKANYDTLKSTLDGLNKNIRDTETAYYDLNILSQLKSEATTQLATYIPQFIKDYTDSRYAKSSLVDTYLAENSGKVDEIYSEYETIIMKYEGKFPELGVKSGSYESNPSTDEMKQLYSNWGQFEFDTMNELVNRNRSLCFLKLYEIYKSSANPNYANLLDDKMISLQSDVNDIYKELYGVRDDGKARSEYDASPESTFGKMNDAKDKLNNLKNSIDAAQLEETKNKIDEASESDSNNKLTETQVSEKEQDTNLADIGRTISYDDTELEPDATFDTNSAPQSCIDLFGFINGMRKLTTSYPYIFQSVTGLDEAYKSYFKMDEPYQGSGENKITISCYESIDMKVSSMFNKYFNAIYDRQYKRERVPMNLKRFECSIFVHDIRNFRHALNITSDGKFNEDNDRATSKILEIALNYLSAVEFKFFDCEIIPEETGNIFDTLNNAELGEQRMTTFSFKYGNCIINFLPFGDLTTYYSTNGNNDELGDTSKTTQPSFIIDPDNNRSKVNTQNEQITDFQQWEEGILKSQRKASEIATGDSLGNVGDDDTNEMREIDEHHIALSNGNDRFQRMMVDRTLTRQGEYYDTLGNVELDDMDEMAEIDAHHIALSNINDRFQRMMIDRTSLRQDELFSNELGNVEFDDGFEMAEIDAHHIATMSHNERRQEREIHKAMVGENTRKDAIRTTHSIGNINTSVDFLLTSMSASTGIPKEQIGENIFGKQDILQNGGEYNGRDTNSSRIVSTTQKIEDGLAQDYNGDVAIPTEPKYVYTAHEVIDDSFKTANDLLYGNNGTPGVHDIKFGTSTTDYVESNDGNQIGKIVEKTEVKEYDDAIENVYNIPTSSENTTEIGSLGYQSVISNKITKNKDMQKLDYDRTKSDITQSEIGNAYKDIPTSKNKTDKIGQIDMKADSIGNTDKVGQIVEKVNKGGDFKSNEVVFKNPKETAIGTDFGVVYKEETTSKIYNADEGVYLKTPTQQGTTKDIDSSVYGDVSQKGTVDDIGKLNQKVDSRDGVELGTVPSDVNQYGKYSDLGNVYTGKIQVSNSDNIGNVYTDTPKKSTTIDDLNDVVFT